MDPFEPLNLSTARLALRFLETSDLPAIFEMYSHPEVMRYLSWTAWTDLSQARLHLREAQEQYRTRSGLQLAVERQTDRAFLGLCTLFHFHFPSRRAEIGYVLHRPYWGHGYMHEALQALLPYAFQSLDLNRLEADIDPRNAASARTLERLGFQREGILRQRWIVNGEVSDTWLYGLLRGEWQERSGTA